MADDPGSPGRPQQNRRETQSRFGRNAVVRSKPRGKIFWSIGVIAALAVIVAVMVQFGPTPSTKRSFVRDWLAERRQVQKQRDMEENLQHVQQVKRQSEALLQKSKVESEAAWSEFNKRMQSPQQTAPQETQTEERLASLKNDGNSAAPEDKQSLAAHHDAVVWLSLSPDGSQLLSASTDKSIKLWDVKTGLLAKDVGRHGEMVRSALFLPGGDKVLSGADDGLIDIWSVGEGRLENTLVAREYGGVRGLAVSADGTLAVSSHEFRHRRCVEPEGTPQAACTERPPVAGKRRGNIAGRQARRFRGHRRRDPDLGHSDRKIATAVEGPRAGHLRCGVPSRWQAGGNRERRWHAEIVEREYRPGGSQFSRPRRYRLCGIGIGRREKRC